MGHASSFNSYSRFGYRVSPRCAAEAWVVDFPEQYLGLFLALTSALRSSSFLKGFWAPATGSLVRCSGGLRRTRYRPLCICAVPSFRKFLGRNSSGPGDHGLRRRRSSVRGLAPSNGLVAGYYSRGISWYTRFRVSLSGTVLWPRLVRQPRSDYLYLDRNGIFRPVFRSCRRHCPGFHFIWTGALCDRRCGFSHRFSLSLMGRFRGGPAKMAIVSSSLFGTISGSAVANVVVDGTMTIPMMKNQDIRLRWPRPSRRRYLPAARSCRRSWGLRLSLLPNICRFLTPDSGAERLCPQYFFTSHCSCRLTTRR